MNAKEARDLTKNKKEAAEAALQSRLAYYRTADTEERMVEEMAKCAEHLREKRKELDTQIRISSSVGQTKARLHKFHNRAISEFDPVGITVLEKTLEEFKNSLIKDGFKVAAKTYKYYLGIPFDTDTDVSPYTWEYKIGAEVEVEW